MGSDKFPESRSRQRNDGMCPSVCPLGTDSKWLVILKAVHWEKTVCCSWKTQFLSFIFSVSMKQRFQWEGDIWKKMPLNSVLCESEILLHVVLYIVAHSVFIQQTILKWCLCGRFCMTLCWCFTKSTQFISSERIWSRRDS